MPSDPRSRGCSPRARYGVPACVVLTGDLTSGGRNTEIKVANKYLRKAHETGAGAPVGLRLGYSWDSIDVPDRAGLFESPGNHDIWRRDNPSQLAEYLNYFGSCFPKICAIHTHNRPVLLYGLNSNESSKMRFRFGIGQIREEQVEGLCETLRAVREDLREVPIQIICLHHPLADPPKKDGLNLRVLRSA